MGCSAVKVKAPGRSRKEGAQATPFLTCKLFILICVIRGNLWLDFRAARSMRAGRPRSECGRDARDPSAAGTPAIRTLRNAHPSHQVGVTRVRLQALVSRIVFETH